MALYYLETSALVKLYVYEPGTDRLLGIVSREAGHRFALLALAQVELRSALRRRERAGDIEKRVVDLLLDRFQQHLEARFVTQAVNEAVIDRAAALIDRHALRAYDAAQLAGCIVLSTTLGGEFPTFVCSDQDLLRAAVSEGLPVLNPCQQN